MTTLLQSALEYAALGFPVLPCRPDKVPYLLAWQKEACCDPDAIRGWWRRWPDAIIGLTPPDGCFVLDVDRHAGGLDGLKELGRLESEHGCLPVTPEADTGGGGRHVWLRTPDGSNTGNRAGTLPKCMQIRGSRKGQVIVAPSPHPSGGVYRWREGRALGKVEIATAPVWLMAMIRAEGEPKGQRAQQAPSGAQHDAPRRYYLKALAYESERVAATPSGERNERLNIAACKLGHYVAGGGLSESEVVDALLEASEINGHVQDDGKEMALATIHGGLKAGKQEPRWAPARNGQS